MREGRRGLRSVLLSGLALAMPAAFAAGAPVCPDVAEPPAAVCLVAAHGLAYADTRDDARLAAAALARPGDVPQQVARDAVTTAEWVARPLGPAPAAIVEETERVADWLERPGVRLIEIDGDWCWPVGIGPSVASQIRISA